MNEQPQQSRDPLIVLREWWVEHGIDRLMELAQSKDKVVAGTCERRLNDLVRKLRQAAQ